MENKINWIKLDKDNAEKQLKLYALELLYVAVRTSHKFVDTDIWDGKEFEEYELVDIQYFARFTMPEYPDD